MAVDRSFLEEVESIEVDSQVRDSEIKITALQDELSALRREKKQNQIEIKRLREVLEFLYELEGKQKKPPAWLAPKKRTKAHVGTLSLLLSDLHLDEVVNASEIEGLNSYNREIAEKRLRRCIEKTIWLSREYISGIHYNGIVVFLGGDIVSGFIHEELSETNECTILETVEYWLHPLESALLSLADEFKNVHVPCVVGNHGRLTRKPRAKRRATDNIDWLIYKLLARDLRNDSRFTWDIPYSADTLVKIYDTEFLFTHGDQFRGGGGISGLLAPLMTGAYKKAKRGMQIDKAFDYIVMGHWHNYAAFKNIIVNGSTKGYDEYAYVSNFEYEPAQQALWLVTPEHGITLSAPVLIEDRKNERW